MTTEDEDWKRADNRFIKVTFLNDRRDWRLLSERARLTQIS